jgi:cation diffusion facilitator family transporter
VVRDSLEKRNSGAEERLLRNAMTVSVVTGVLMIVLKFGGFALTHSTAILSDAAESIVHLAAVLFAAYSLHLSHKPADDTHLYGHAKISFFSAGVEGAVILLAAIYIYAESIQQIIRPAPLENLGVGVVLTLLAAVVNGLLGWFLIRIGERHESLVLEANGQHVLTDCWTSLGVVIGLLLTIWTGWRIVDPLVGILVATNILIAGVRLVISGLSGLMDQADPQVQRRIREILDRETQRHGTSYHNLRHRNLGDALWIDVHLLFPEGILLSEAHRIATEIEAAIDREFRRSTQVTTHLESALDHHILHPD